MRIPTKGELSRYFMILGADSYISLFFKGINSAKKLWDICVYAESNWKNMDNFLTTAFRDTTLLSFESH